MSPYVVWKLFLQNLVWWVKDRWGHLSESKEISLTPYYEEEVDKKKMGYLAIGEYKGYLAPNANTPKNLYDGIIGSNNTFYDPHNGGI